ncbi:extracellular solute-binding protein [Paenibacillus humicola]|uniref:extracellular solute-binding protein n=1 Tax=Paenibacillus humicola TaxID=3110540 RepID=UPI00237B2100|nr:extracellular solute-binding protein [Paenibacillus humicola]
MKPNRKIACLAFIAACTLALSACSSDKQNGTSASTGDSGSNASSSAQTDGSSGKYNPPITIHAARNVQADWIYDKGEDINNNVWTKEFEDNLGIKMTYDWTAPSTDDYTNKMNVVIASGDTLPDMFEVNAAQLQQLADADQLEDLTDVFNKEATPLTKKLMNGDGGIAMSAATFDGKLLAIPHINGTITNNDVLWIRSDWMKKLGLSAPKSIDDLVKIADAFVNKDPDGDGKKDTFGLGLLGSPQLGMTGGSSGDLGGWFAAFNAYPDIWIKDSTGKIVYGSIQPEVKTGLAKLQEMYKNGLIDKEWSVKDAGKFGEDIINNKLGMFYGANWNSYSPMNISKNQQLDNMKPYSIVSVDGKQPVVQAVNPSVDQYVVVKKGYAHPEAIIRLLNDFQEKMWGATGDYEKFGAKPGSSPEIDYFKYPLVQSWPVTKDIPDNLDAVHAALDSGDVSKLNSEQAAIVKNIKAYEAGDIVKGWGQKRQYDAFDIIKKDDLNNQLNSEFYGAPTPTMVTKKASLDTLEQQEFTKIIMGAAPIDEFDKFVADWKKLGGDQITQEVNDWKAQHK